MTDANEVLNQGMPGLSENNNATAPSSPTPAGERMFTQAELDGVARKRASESYERGLREGKTHSSPDVSTSGSGTTTFVGGMRQQSHEEIERLIEERTTQKFQELSHQNEQKALVDRQENFYRTHAQDFVKRISDGQQTYSDFDDVVAKMNLTSIASLIPFLNGVDNTKDVVYDIAKNPAKIAQLLVLASQAPHLVVSQIQDMSSGIKQNQEALNRKKPNAPLSQINPSYTGTDSGEMTISDLRQVDWLRR